MKLDTVTFNNFRIFKNETFKFNPLTILTGVNSSGKSTIVKALMLLQENLTPKNNLGRLTFKDGLHKLGNFESILTRGIDERSIIFTLKFENTDFFDSKVSKHILNQVQFITITREYEQDEFQTQNGILKRFIISIDDDTDLIKCFKNDIGNFEIEINHKWFIDKILNNGLFQFNPLLYKIWDKLRVDEINETLETWRERLSSEEEMELQNIIVDDEEYLRLNERLSDLNKNGNSDLSNKYKLIVKQIREIEQEYENKINSIEKEIDELDSSVDRDEEQERRNNLYEEKEILNRKRDDEKSELYGQLEAMESQNDSLIREVFEEKADIEDRLDIIVEKAENKIKDEYQKLKDTVREGNIRSLLYNQLKNASQSFLLSLKDIEIKKEVSDLDKRTIADYLINQEWGDKIYALTENEEVKLIADLVSWTHETLFIKKATLEDRRTEEEIAKDEKDGIRETDYKGVRFHDIVGKGNNNQLAKLLINKISELIQFFNKPLPLISLSAMRGFQQRIYKTSQTTYHLEDALSNLLDMQHENRQQALDFITNWIFVFGITKNKNHRLIAEIIEGDYVRGFIEEVNVSNDEEKITRTNIADLGLGISQLLPIIIYTASTIDKNQLICIEEPGTHLHPNLQAKLVEFMLSISKSYGIQFLVETHSEVFIRKLQYEVAHKENCPSDSILIRYIDNSQNQSVCQKITINEDGDLFDLETKKVIASFGNGFLDEGTKWVNKRLLEKVDYGEQDVKNLIKAGETNEIEFKASMFKPVYSVKDKKWLSNYDDLMTKAKNNSKMKDGLKKQKKEINEKLTDSNTIENIIHSVIKTLAAFANSNGGELVIGIDEDKNQIPYILGIKDDVDSFKDNKDGFLKKFDEIIETQISDTFHSLIKLHWINISEENKEVLLIKVLKSKMPIFCKEKGEQLFYIRRAASTKSLNMKDMYDYNKKRFE